MVLFLTRQKEVTKMRKLFTIILLTAGVAFAAYNFGGSWATNNPTGIDLAVNGDVYVCNLGTNVISVYTSTGSLITSLSHGLNTPYAVGYMESNDRTYVADTYNNRIVWFDHYTYGGEYSNFNSPHGVAVSYQANRIIVADTNNNRVVCYDPWMTPQWEKSGSKPYGVAVTPNGSFAYVTMSGASSNQIVCYKVADGSINSEWGTYGNGGGQFTLPTYITVSNNLVFVSDSSNGNLQYFTRTGSFVNFIGGVTTPYGLAVKGTGGRIYVAEYSRDRIVYYNGGDAVEPVSLGKVKSLFK
jgi:DNA-binding beta-propeller fold protein YncE